jgi:hypothetical protein
LFKQKNWRMKYPDLDNDWLDLQSYVEASWSLIPRMRNMT